MFLMIVLFTGGARKVIAASRMTDLRQWRKLNGGVVADWRICDRDREWVDSHSIESWRQFDAFPKHADYIIYKGDLE